jgi:hypothetical protein
MKDRGPFLEALSLVEAQPVELARFDGKLQKHARWK